MRVSSSTTHAYIANRPLLDWLDATEPMDPYTPIRSRLIGRGIDAAFACLPWNVRVVSNEDHPASRRGGPSR